MRTQTTPVFTQKIISIDPNTKKILTYQAVENGISLKAYIEQILRNVAEIQEDKMLTEIFKADINDLDNPVLKAKEKKAFEKKLFAMS